MFFFSLATDDFTDDEEVQSFGYKRFGEYWATCFVYPPKMTISAHKHVSA